MGAQSEFKIYFSILEILGNKVPVDKPIEVLQVSGSGIAIVNVVGMFPDINSQKRDVVVGKWVAGIWGIENGDFIILFGKPGPSWAEISNGLSWEIFKELVYTAPFVYNQFFEFSFWFSFVGGNAVPIESMIPMLSSIIEDFSVFTSK